ncbi:hypothetical protein [Streptomyces sp. 8N706]|uniref:hypothetical protein n=1 Tax=Streptomyces sp. 8N706 TaxID=3457416 RepID=UPI003FD42D3A
MVLNLASFCDAVAVNVRKGNQNVGLSWDGNGAASRLTNQMTSTSHNITRADLRNSANWNAICAACA